MRCAPVFLQGEIRFRLWLALLRPAKAQNVTTKTDRFRRQVRTEVNLCEMPGHLGHVFEGEGFGTPTDLRYCINGGGLVSSSRPNGGETAFDRLFS